MSDGPYRTPAPPTVDNRSAAYHALPPWNDGKENKCPKCNRMNPNPNRYHNGHNVERKCDVKYGEHMHIDCFCGYSWPCKTKDSSQ